MNLNLKLWIMMFYMLIQIIYMVLLMFMMYLIKDFNLMIEFELMKFNSKSINFMLIMDIYSMSFVFVVSLISMSILMFSKFYMKNDKFKFRFYFLLMMFVISMYMLILSPNLVSIMIGWDGLGLSSYLLVIYYMNMKSLNAGMLTAMVNRIGDSLILMIIIIMYYHNSFSLMILNKSLINNMSLFLILMILASSTKSAQIPFSAWLPAAMAAPTPVSALVHSSTLVTAGVYLMFRIFNNMVFTNSNYFLMYIGIITMLMSSFSAMFEMDLKKIVALSTLSQLGIMMLSLGSGLLMLGFIHLISHAFFKALLFISMGMMIFNSKSYQDLRFTKNYYMSLPFSFMISLSSSMSLMGFPFMSGFFSKEIILEMLITKNLNFMIYFLMMFGIFLTMMYSMRLMIFLFFSFQPMLSTNMMVDNNYMTNNSMLILLIPAITMTPLFMINMTNSPIYSMISINEKLIPIFMMMMSIILFKYYMLNIKYNFNLKYWILGNLWSLNNISNKFPIYMFNYSGKMVYEKLDLGWISYFIHEFLLIPNKLLLSKYYIMLNILYNRSYLILFLMLMSIILY